MRLRSQGAAIQKNAAQAEIDHAKSQQAFDNVFQAMDAIDRFGTEAARSMKLTVQVLEGQVSRARRKLERRQDSDAATTHTQGVMMSRFTIKNVFKVMLVVVFFPFIAFLVLIIGMGAKNKKVLLEGVVYGAVFVLAFSLPGGSGAFAGLAAMGLSAVRSYLLRDLWIPRRGRKSQHGAPVQAQAQTPTFAPAPPSPAASSFAQPSDDLSTSLTWVSSLAKQNKHRLPADTYVTILETCQMLDSVIDTENRQPSADAGFEYELEAVVSEYLPAVLQGYLAIPPSMVENRQPNGKTPNEELVEQLGLLLRQAETLHAARHSQTSADLTITGNFLRERFGHHQQGGSGFGLK